MQEMAIPGVQAKTVVATRAAKRWRVAAIKIQAAQRFAKLVHFPEEEKLFQARGFNMNNGRVRELCKVEDIFQNRSKRYTCDQTHVEGNGNHTSVLVDRLRRGGQKEKLNHNKSLYFWDYEPGNLHARPQNVERFGQDGEITDKVSERSKRNLSQSVISEDNFKSIRIIGSGSSGQVYLVKDCRKGTEYAMKVMNKLDVISKQRAERVLLEKEILCKMNDHKLFTNLFYAFHTSSHTKPWRARFYLVMEYCAHGNLHEVVIDRFQKRHNLLTNEELNQCKMKAAAGDGLDTFKSIVASKKEQASVSLSRSCIKLILTEVAVALDALHTVGYAFRDLKPQNILLHADGHVRVGDFGVAKVISEKRKGATRTSTFVGTLEYMAPEIVAGDSQSGCVDWWAYGILAYELLYGETPFKKKIVSDSSTCQKDLFFSIMEPERIEYPPVPGKKTKPLVRLIKMQLRVNPQKRLNIGQVKASDYFRKIKWDSILEGKGPGNSADATSLLKTMGSGLSGKLASIKFDSRLRKQKASCDLGLKDDIDEAPKEFEPSSFHSGLTIECRKKAQVPVNEMSFDDFQWSQ